MTQKSDGVLTEAKKLYDLGFAVHWIKPRSKVPVNSGWTKGPRAEWGALKAAYRSGMNVGVRLGRASELQGAFAAVIDCDVKGTEERHRHEMLSKLKEVVPELVLTTQAFPAVTTGRGNGSQHLYVATAAPATPARLAQSSEMVRVHMPSSGPASARDRAEIAVKDLAQGWRLRPAWEISLMGEGQQVVVPPSVHPDTGANYSWKWKLQGPAVPPRIELPAASSAAGAARAEVDNAAPHATPMHFLCIDWVASPLPDGIVNMVLQGEGVTDRSNALLTVTTAMLRAGMSEDEVLSGLTERDTFLGAAAFEHAKTRDRRRAAEWLRRYTLAKARREIADDLAFDSEVEITLSGEEAAAQAADLVAPAAAGDWRLKLDRTSEKTGRLVKSTFRNVKLILQNAAGPGVKLFREDEFQHAVVYGAKPPWKGECSEAIRNIDLTRVKDWIAAKFKFEPGDDKILQAIAKVGDENAFHPVREYLDALEWDGVPRIDTWLRDYCNADAPEPYLSAVSRKVLCAMVARAYVPGTKYDYVLILEGSQGIGKSTVIRYLATDPWFTDTTVNIQDKDAVLNLGAVWIVEMGELSGMRKADENLLKEFIGRTTDRIRVPYGKLTERFPRQCIFIGTTNSDEYLTDPSGNRRFWPVKVGACDFERVKRDRDQLFAEAKFAWELGELLYLDEKEAAALAMLEQEARMTQDSWGERFAAFFDAHAAAMERGETPAFDAERFTMHDVFEHGPLMGEKDSPAYQNRAGKTLRKMGYRVRVTRVEGGLKRIWTRK